MGKIEDAIKKINTEIQKEPSNRYLALVGEHIIDNITSEAAAEKVLKKEKTLAKALAGIENQASKQKEGNCAVIEDSVVYGWAREYFGLTANPQAPAEEPKKGRLRQSGRLPVRRRGHESEKDTSNAVCPVLRGKQCALEGNGQGASGGRGTPACG